MPLNTSDLLVPLMHAGLTVQIAEGKQLAITPAERLTDELRQYIRQHKDALLALLSKGPLVWLAQSTWPNEAHRFADAARWAYTSQAHATRFPDYASCLSHCQHRGLYRPVVIHEHRFLKGGE